MIYYVNEFEVNSEIPLPLDAEIEIPSPNEGRLSLRRASLSDIPCTMRRLRWQTVYDVGDGFLLDRPGVSLHIDFHGKVMTVDCPDAEIDTAAGWIVHVGLGAATLTHGGIPLHGAGLEIDGRYVALMAQSGVGKSTLLWHLLQRGAKFANDDLIPVRISDGVATASPARSGYPKLERSIVERSGLRVENLIVSGGNGNKECYYVPLPITQRVFEPAPLAACFILAPAEVEMPMALRHIGSLITSRRLPTDEAAFYIQNELHAVWLLKKWIDQRAMNDLCLRLAETVPVYMIAYPRVFSILGHLEQTIHACLASE